MKHPNLHHHPQFIQIFFACSVFVRMPKIQAEKNIFSKNQLKNHFRVDQSINLRNEGFSNKKKHFLKNQLKDHSKID